MSVDREYRVRIRIESDSAAAGEAAGALDRVGTSTRKVGEETKEHGKQYLHAEGAGRSFHRVLHSISEESPIMGMALRMALSPVPGLMMAAAWGMHSLIKAEKDAAQAAHDAAEEMSHGMGNVRDAAQQAAEDIATHNRDFEDWLVNLHKGTEDVKNALDEEITKLKLIAATNEEVLKQREELAKAKIAEAVALGPEAGGISKEEGIIREAELERQFAHRRSDQKQADLLAEIELKRKAAQDLSWLEVNIGQDVRQLKARLDDEARKTAKAKVEDDIKKLAKTAGGETLTEQMEALRKARAAAAEAAEKVRREPFEQFITTPQRWLVETAAGQKIAAQALETQATVDKMVKAQEAMAKLHKAHVAMTAEEEQLTKHLEAAKADFADVDRQWEEIGRSIRMMRAEFNIRGSAAAPTLAAGDQAAGARGFTKMIGESDWDKLLFDRQTGGVADAASKILRGQAPEKAQLAELDAAMKFMGANIKNGEAIIRMFAGALGTLAAHAAAIRMLDARGKQLQNSSTRLLPGSG